MPVGRQKNHEETQHADEVVVVEVGGFVHQLNVGKAEEKQAGTETVPPASCHSQRADNTYHKE